MSWCTRRTLCHDIHLEHYVMVYTQNIMSWCTLRTLCYDAHSEHFVMIHAQNIMSWCTLRTLCHGVHSEHYGMMYTQNIMSWCTLRTFCHDARSEHYVMMHAQQVWCELKGFQTHGQTEFVVCYQEGLSTQSSSSPMHYSVENKTESTVCIVNPDITSAPFALIVTIMRRHWLSVVMDQQMYCFLYPQFIHLECLTWHVTLLLVGLTLNISLFLLFSPLYLFSSIICFIYYIYW